MLLLLDEAMESYRSALSEIGLSGPRRRRGDPERSPEHRAVADAVAPLVLPEGLDALWSGWELDSFEAFERHGSRLLLPSEVLDRWPVGDRVPRVLLPIVEETEWLVAIELATDDHPGSRLLELDHKSGPRVFAVGVARLFELATEAILERRFSGLSSESPEFWKPAWRGRSSSSREVSQQGAAFLRPKEWPDHWRDAEGVDESEFAPRGATHTVAEFIEARSGSDSLAGTLVGTFDTKVAGGVLNGAVGDLIDETGSIQVFVPKDVDEYGGPSGRIEVDVVASEPSGTLAATLPQMPTGEGITAEQYSEYMLALLTAMGDLDRSVVATAVRQIDE